MSKIPMEVRGRRTQFFPHDGGDQSVTMLLELMSEVWAIRERMYALENVAADQGLDLTAAIESWQPNPQQAAELDKARHTMIESVMRSVADSQQSVRQVRRSLDTQEAPRVGISAVTANQADETIAA